MVLKKAVLPVVIAMTTLLIPTMALAEGYGSVAVNVLNVRQDMTTDAPIVTKISKNEEVKITDLSVNHRGNQWYEIETRDGSVGYVYAEYINVEEIEGKISDESIPLRDYPDAQNSETLKTLDRGEVVIVDYLVGDWYNVNTSRREGFVHKNYVDTVLAGKVPTKTLDEIVFDRGTNEIETDDDFLEEVGEIQEAEIVQEEENLEDNDELEEIEEEIQEEIEEETSVSLAETIVTDAMQFLGNPYVYGGNSLTNGVDCSGFVQQILKRHGVSISRSSSSQYATDGYKVSKSDLQIGDLLFYGYGGSISHVAMYMGDGQVIHASTSSTGIRIDGAFNVGKPYVGAKRIL